MKHEAGIMNNGKIKSFTDLNAWKEGHVFVLEIYKLTYKFPRDEQLGLINQIRRSVVSVTSNIAESFSRSSYKEKSQFYSMALGSLTESQNQLIIARDLNYISEIEHEAILERVIIISKLLNGLIKKSRTMIHNS
jgi:four helix bundle protein